MSFLVWHILAILTVMAVSCIIGYSVGRKDITKKILRKNNDNSN